MGGGGPDEQELGRWKGMQPLSGWEQVIDEGAIEGLDLEGAAETWEIARRWALRGREDAEERNELLDRLHHHPEKAECDGENHHDDRLDGGVSRGAAVPVSQERPNTSFKTLKDLIAHTHQQHTEERTVLQVRWD